MKDIDNNRETEVEGQRYSDKETEAKAMRQRQRLGDIQNSRETET